MRREGFSGRVGLIAAAAGSAIGLGNIWKFPYILGRNGGGAFLIVYLICIAIIGLPLVLTEFAIGRKGQANAVQAFENIMPKKKFWKFAGTLSMITSFIILSFYSMIAGWVFAYMFKYMTGSLSKVPVSGLTDYFNNLAGSYEPIFWTVVVLAITAFIVHSGIKDGIEKCSKILMPVLLVLLGVLMVRSLTLDGAMEGIKFLFKPNFSSLDGKAFLEALAHCFYSLSIGLGILITFGSYTSKEEDIPKVALSLTLADTGIALIAGLVIFPAVFAYGFEPTAGVGLIFMTIPAVFNEMPLGTLFGSLFFLAVGVAAITSTTSLLEVATSVVTEKFNISRTKAVVMLTALLGALSVLSILSFGDLSDVTIFGKTFFDIFDFSTEKIFLPAVGLMTCLFAGWVWKPKNVEEELCCGGNSTFKLSKIYSFIIKFVAPVAIICIFLYFSGIYKIFS